MQQLRIDCALWTWVSDWDSGGELNCERESVTSSVLLHFVPLLHYATHASFGHGRVNLRIEKYSPH